MLAKIEGLTSLMEGDTYYALSLSGEGVPLAPHCVRQILRAPHPMYPKTPNHEEDHVAMQEMLNDMCVRINSYESLKLIESELKKTVSWLSAVNMATPEFEFEKTQLLTDISKVLSVRGLENAE